MKSTERQKEAEQGENERRDETWRQIVQVRKCRHTNRRGRMNVVWKHWK